LSLQELIIPVLTVWAGKSVPLGGPVKIAWQITPGQSRITTRFIGVTISGEARELLAASAPRVRVELRASGQLISTPVSATHGFQDETRDVIMAFQLDSPQQLIPNTITLRIAEKPAAATVTLVLLDADTGVALGQPLVLPIEIAF
jgi:hypothetical protein